MQRRLNQSTEHRWWAFAGHRQQMMALIERATVGVYKPSVCILGAGNCNDVDLVQLTEDCAALQLVDLDAQALRTGVRRQLLNPQLCSLVENFDLTNRALRAKIDDLRHLDSIWEPADVPGGPFDLVISACVLSQLIDSLHRRLGSHGSGDLGRLAKLRQQHIRTMIRATRPGGKLLLVFDFLSSESCPELRWTADLRGLVADELKENNCFLGLNPYKVLSVLQDDPKISAHLARAVLLGPWAWDIGNRVYAVCAVEVERV